MEQIAIGLGGNVGDSPAMLRQALVQLRGRLGPLRVAPTYRTQPIVRASPRSSHCAGAQADFLNTVAVVDIDYERWPARRLLGLFKRLEAEAGRVPGPIDGPRPLDLDLLLVGDRVIEEARDSGNLQWWPGSLVVPHPRLRQRRFVLAPLADLEPDWRLPPDGASVAELLHRLGDSQKVERIGSLDSV